jgi:hypothetical protein
MPDGTFPARARDEAGNQLFEVLVTFELRRNGSMADEG